VRVSIDVENASGVRYGNGPISTAVQWTTELRLDQAGGFLFTMPAADPQAALLANKRYVRCWSQEEGRAKQQEGYGIIDRIRRLPSTGGPTMLEISGDDILRELSRRTVGNLGLYTDRSFAAAELVHVISGGEATVLHLPETVDLQSDPLSFIFVKSSEPFSRLTITLGSPVNGVVASLQAQYYSGDSDDWVNLQVDDGTENVDGKTLAQSGTITFSIPDDWAPFPDSFEYWQVRLYCQDIDLSPVRLNALTMGFREPTFDALQMIMALAPPGWSLDPVGGYTATQNPKGVYLQFSGQESILTAFGRVAQQTGEHFALGFSGRRIRWLGNDKLASGLRAIGGEAGGEPDESTMLLTELTQTDDSYDLVTRLYPTGGGSGASVVTLAKTTRTVPAGYVLSTTENYLERTSEYGRIDAPANYPDIVAESIFDLAAVYAANSLFDRTYEELRRVSELQTAYEATAIPSQYQLWPGHTIQIDYDEWAGSFHSIDVHDVLWVLGVKRQVSPDGIYTVAMTVATIDRWPTNDFREVAQTIGTAETSRSQPLPTQGHTSQGKGMPYQLSVKNGLVTGCLREEGVADGVYENIRWFIYRNGVCVDMIPWD